MCTPYTGLAFSFAETLCEIEYMRAAASKFITATSKEGVIRDWRQDLRNFQTNPGNGTHQWRIPENRPIETDWNEGQSELDGNGPNLRGRLSCTWAIRIENYRGKKADRRVFVLDGLASITVRIMQRTPDGEEGEASRWHFDVANATAPGCHFHAQVSGVQAGGADLSIPRLPSLVVTPMDALEFMLAELFQRAWLDYSSRETKEIKSWSPYPRKRLSNLLAWQHSIVMKESSGAPWTAIKHSKPSRYMIAPELTP